MAESAHLRLALAQINPTVGDLDGNAALIAEAIGSARGAGAQLVVLPEPERLPRALEVGDPVRT